MRRFVFVWVLIAWAGMLCAQSLPVVTITTDSAIVNTPAVHGTITVDDGNGTVIEMHAGFKIRGTSSQQWDKKSYRVELWADETGEVMADTTFLGMRSDDDWNLEAMYNQPLRLRDKFANELWREIYTLPYLESEPDAVPSVGMEYVEVYLNGSYVGVYLLTERVDRKLLGLRKYNGNLRGLLFKGNGPGNASFEALPDYDNTLDEWDQFEWVYPNESDTVIDWSSLYSLVNFVMNATDNAFYSQYASMFELDNLVDYYLFVNVLGALDNMDRNTFLARYKKSSAFFYVPWDLDAILGNTNDGEHDESVDGFRSNGLYDRLAQDCAASGFVALAQSRYNSLRESTLSKTHLMELIQAQYDELVAMGAYEREHEAWPDYTVDESELDYISEWLDGRLNWLDAEINAACGTWEEPEAMSSQVEVFPNPAKDHVCLRLAESGETSVMVYDMTGRRVLSTISSDPVITLSTKGLRNGIYTIVVNQNGKQWGRKLRIEN